MFFKIVLALFALLTIKYGVPFVKYLIKQENKRKHMINVLGPDCLPIIGSIHKLPRKSEELLSFLTDEANKIWEKGESVMRLWIGPKLIVFPLDTDATKVITNSTTEIDKGVDYEFFQQWLGNGILTGTGDYWLKMRKMVSPVFHLSKLEEYAEVMDSQTRIMIQLISEKANEDEINLLPFVQNCALDTIVETVTGIQMNAQLKSDQLYVKSIGVFNSLALVYWNNPFYGMFNDFLWKLFGYKAQIDEALNVLKSTSRKIVKERIEVYEDFRQNGMEKTKNVKLNFLDILLECNSENKISMEQIRDEIDTFMFAGHDTTTHAVVWTIWCLATHPEIQTRLYNEIIHTFGLSDIDFKTPLLKELKYLDMVLKESMRLFAPVPLIQRKLKEDQIIGGHLIPKDTTICIPIFILHRNPKIFSEPNKFNPENFNEKEYKPMAYIPFSAGSRSCIGQKFAIREAKIIISHLVFNFKFSTHFKLHDNLPRMESVSSPSLGIPVKIVLRN